MPENDKHRFHRKRSYPTASQTFESDAIFPTLAKEVEATTCAELAQYVFTSQDGFIDCLFAGVDHVDDIHSQCVAASDYDRDGRRWTAYPAAAPNKEAPLYAPFVEIANSITSKAQAFAKTNNTNFNRVKWMNQHSLTPPKQDSSAADLRPDIAVAIGAVTGKAASWRHFLAPLEVKKDGKEKPALVQLLMYQRQIFREAVDRRFVIGFTLALTKMRVYLADRSGVIGNEVFDINDVCSQ